MQHSPSEAVNGGAARPAPPFPRLVPWLLVVGGAVGLAAAFTLTLEKLALLRDPAYVPTCSINPVLSCGSVMTKPQAEAFGFPNPLLGLVCFTIVVTVGVALLGGARLPRWIWLGLQAGVTFGAVFVHWLIYQSLYVIGALCPYCMAVWAVTIPIFWYVTLDNLGSGRLPGPSWQRGVVRGLTNYHAVALTLWFLAVLTLIGVRFWAYWSTLLA
ncbi:vitamin K epoxide reductase family protein [Flindersiella endophytica]